MSFQTTKNVAKAAEAAKRCREVQEQARSTPRSGGAGEAGRPAGQVSRPKSAERRFEGEKTSACSPSKPSQGRRRKRGAGSREAEQRAKADAEAEEIRAFEQKARRDLKYAARKARQK